MRDEKEERKKQARSNKQTRQSNTYSTPKAVTFPKKNELPQVGLKPTTHVYMYTYVGCVVSNDQYTSVKFVKQKT